MKTVFSEKSTVYLPAPHVKLSDGWSGGRVLPWHQTVLITSRWHLAWWCGCEAICPRECSQHGNLGEKHDLVKNEHFLIADFLYNCHFRGPWRHNVIFCEFSLSPWKIFILWSIFSQYFSGYFFIFAFFCNSKNWDHAPNNVLVAKI